MTKDNCGFPTNDGTACEHPATEANGRCWLHADDDRDIGRPSKFSDDRARAAIEAARQSKSKGGCARAAEIDRKTLDYWIEKNPEFEAADGELTDFSPAFARARRDGETVLVQGGLRNDEVDTSMAKFLLATSFGYVKTEERRVTGEGGDALEVTLTREVVDEPRD